MINTEELPVQDAPLITRKIRVYQQFEIDPFAKDVEDGDVVDGRFLRLVAEVETDDPNCLERAYVLTNTIQWEWWINPGVTTYFPGKGCRSTSIGDVMQVSDRWFQVARMGFKQVTVE